MSTAVKLYPEVNLSGKSVTITTGENYSHLSSAGINDNVKSMVVAEGCYAVVFQDSDFGGNRKVFEAGTYNNLSDEWNYGMSSIRTYTRCAAIIYTDPGYSGSSMVVDGDIDSFKNTGFYNDKISSIWVMPGYDLTFYTDYDFSGDSHTYQAKTSDVGDSWNDKFSSVSVHYEFGVYVYSKMNYKGSSIQLSKGSFNAAGYSDFTDGFLSFKVNPGYSVEVFDSPDCTGDSKKYKGPCDITRVNNAGLSILVADGCYAVRVESSSTAENLTTSVPKLSRYDLDDSITSITVKAGYIVHLFEDTDYTGNSRILVARNNDQSFTLSGTANISSIRVIDLDFPAVYLFNNGGYTGEYVMRTDPGKSDYNSWYSNNVCGRMGSVGNDELSTVIITGNLKAELFKDASNSGDSMTIYGPGFFDLNVKSSHKTLDEHLFNDTTSSITISSYTPHHSASGVRGYDGLIFLKGDLHNHTLWSDAFWGGETDSIGIPLNRYIYDPSDTFSIYQALGYDFDGISDHVFGKWADGSDRYTDGSPKVVGKKYALSRDQWEDTKNYADKYEHNLNFSSFAGYEYSLGGVAMLEADHTDDPADTTAHYNVFGTDQIYYGQPDGWANTPDTREDFYRWAAKEYGNNPDLVIQFNHPGSGNGFNYFTEAAGAEYDRTPFKLIEVFSKSADGSSTKTWVDSYELALANGWKVAPTATSDNHDCFCVLRNSYFDIRTVVAAEASSKDCVLAAVKQRRVYAIRYHDFGIAFSLTNTGGTTAVMGSDLEKDDCYYLDLTFAECNGMITAVELHTDNTVISVAEQENSWNKNNFILDSDEIKQAKYMFIVVKTEQYTDYAAITAPIWFV